MKENKDSLKVVEAMNDINDTYLAGTEETAKPERKRSPWVRVTAIAACVCLLAGSVAVIKNGWFRTRPAAVQPEVTVSEEKNETPSENTTGGEIKEMRALIPEAPYANADANTFRTEEDHWTWWEEYRDEASRSADTQKNMTEYYKGILPLLLSGEGNKVCSPTNIYLALAMLAETADGDTRQQILSALHVKDTEALQKQADAIWTANQVNTPSLRSNLAASCWLNDQYNYNEAVLKTLAEVYHASSFQGPMGSAEMDQALRDWVNENTDHLLEQHTENMQLQPDTVLRLVTTVYFKAAWADHFNENETKQETFHGEKGDRTVDMMHNSLHMYYKGDNFGAVRMNLIDSGSMIFVLPDEGVSLEDVYGSDQYLALLAGDEAAEKAGVQIFTGLVNLSLPKFDESASVSLKDALQNLGVSDAFDPTKANFSPLSDQPAYVSAVEHAACVTIDEEGVTGAAYTDIAMASGALLMTDPIDFVLDRPFTYMVAGLDGSLLFAGTIR